MLFTKLQTIGPSGVGSLPGRADPPESAGNRPAVASGGPPDSKMSTASRIRTLSHSDSLDAGAVEGIVDLVNAPGEASTVIGGCLRRPRQHHVAWTGCRWLRTPRWIVVDARVATSPHGLVRPRGW